MRDRERRADASADQQTTASVGQPADKHAGARAHADFGQVLSVNAVTLELAFRIYVGSVPQAGVYHGRIEYVPFAVRQNYGLGKNSDRGFARDTPWVVDFGDPPLHGGARWNY